MAPMGLIDKLKGTAPQDGTRQTKVRQPGPKHELTEEEREQVIEDARSELPELDKAVEENLSRLRDLSRS